MVPLPSKETQPELWNLSTNVRFQTPVLLPVRPKGRAMRPLWLAQRGPEADVRDFVFANENWALPSA